jgi:predicted permease
VPGSFQNLRYGLRSLRKSPGFSLAVLWTLALGIGVNAAAFSLVDGFLLRPLPYPQADRLGALLLHSEGTVPSTGRRLNDEEDSHDGDTWDWLRDNIPMARVASYGGLVSGVNLSTSSSADAGVRYVENMRVSAHYFDVLGIPLFLGREFTEEEDRHGGPAAVIVSYDLWHSLLHSDAQIVGKAIQLKGAPYTVVGVLPRQAQTNRGADVWTPLQPAPTGECGGENCGILMRLLPGATWQQVNAQLAHLRNRNFDTVETTYKGHMWFHASPMKAERGREARAPVLVLMLAVSFILLIGCANLAALMLVRMARRTPEIATRLALGATRATLLRQLWMENLILALLGGAAGLGLAVPVLKFLGGFLPPEAIPLGGLPIDGRILLFTLAAAFLTSALFGALPVLETWKVDMRPSVSSHSMSRGTGRLRPLLISGEIALTIVLLAGAGVLIRTLLYLENLPNGFDARNVITAKASLDVSRYHDPIAFHNLLERSVAEMKQIPGVEDAALGLSVPYERGLNYGARVLDGKFAGEGLVSSVAYVTPGYFPTLRIPILSGRGFSEDDAPHSEFVGVVNQAFARKFFDESNPLGRHLQMDGNSYRIVGIVANVIKQQGISPDAPIGYEPVYYLPATQMAQGTVNIAHVWFQPSWIVRSAKPLDGIAGQMQKALAQIDHTLPFSGFYSMSDILNENLQLQRAQALLLGVLAGLALLLSAVGIYALVANLIAQRTREIGIRLALGAQVKQVIVEISKSGLLASLAGLLAGLAMATAAVRGLRSQVYGVGVYDPMTFVAVPLLLAAIAVAASFAPTLRITRIDPAETLRVE